MFHYELHQLRQRDLVHEASSDRRAREATGRFVARRSAGDEAEGRVRPPRGRRAVPPRRATA
ncbi:hypothetical protein [Streptomyces buecherae]|uniref:hypothetical protein n=1 Tax=Streptomyces buecherae TaxID=2763006 RepID=UPI0033843782